MSKNNESLTTKERIIVLNSLGMSDEEIAEEVGEYSCVGEEFEYPSVCGEDYCEQCWINKVEEILDDEHLKKINKSI